MVWSVSYVHDGPKIKDMPIENTNGTPEETRRKLVAKLEIQKDDIQAVLPISKVCLLFFFGLTSNVLLSAFLLLELGVNEYSSTYWASGVTGHESIYCFSRR